jgi:hypothetical protein
MREYQMGRQRRARTPARAVTDPPGRRRQRRVTAPPCEWRTAAAGLGRWQSHVLASVAPPRELLPRAQKPYPAVEGVTSLVGPAGILSAIACNQVAAVSCWVVPEYGGAYPEEAGRSPVRFPPSSPARRGRGGPRSG